MQGDIAAIYNSAGTKLVSYTYTAWGNTTKTYHNGGADTTAAHNNLTYRGYYYDSDLGMYYLQTRYYDAEICRFINADSALYHSMIGYNMFAYCYNNPINYVDMTGESPGALASGWATSAWWLTMIDGALPIGDIIYWSVLGILAIAVVEAATDAKKDKPKDKPDSLAEPEDITEVDDDDSLPNQGSVSAVPDAPPVDAGKQGKHVIGHNNDQDPSKTKWNLGENGVRQTQEAWKNSKPHPNKPNTRIGISGDGRTIEIKVGKNGIHGYPIFP